MFSIPIHWTAKAYIIPKNEDENTTLKKLFFYENFLKNVPNNICRWRDSEEKSISQTHLICEYCRFN